ncbi:ArgP/LysG family DNA-binding transcriptional regulator [Chromobacterium phragmitis]|uniref:ArgP/LysG family DNA-binding transcriptional regulator n=1 Tax=Chromobacterium phragmitis TaxID=2202141 RepID=A0ABV0IP37_9NEIS|nr:ArgP/LysG family DNA-binding transcriptional regulator [Chromobacterium phragmitis]AXE31978.1 ArgP/LysG family DNA-binding transcriptional regulator [Chromobacterium phragmitis]
MIDPKQLQTLAAVAETGGFDKAAKKLFLTQSAVSQRIRQLEEQLGQPVLTRTSPADATEAGRQLLRHYQQLLLMENQLLQKLSPAPRQRAFTTLAVGVNADSLATWYLQAVAPVAAAHDLLLDVALDDQDHTHELMRTGHVMGCVSTRAAPIQGGVLHYLGAMRYLCVCTPAFAARHFPDGVDHASLARAPSILFSRKDAVHGQFLRQAAGYDGGFPSFTVPSAQGFVELTRQGGAYSLLPELMLDDDLAQGRLVDLFPGQHMDLPLYWHHWRVESELSQALTEAMLDYCAHHLRQDKVSYHAAEGESLGKP